MAKKILRLFGGLTIAAGFAVVALAFESKGIDKGTLLLTFVPIASALILAGSMLLGFAQVIGLLERIEENTAPKSGAPTQWLTRPTE